MQSLPDEKLSPTSEANLKATRHDINCVGIALSKCLSESQGKIVLYLINKKIIGKAEDLQFDGTIPNVCRHLGWQKLFQSGATWDKTRQSIETNLEANRKYFAVNWGNAGKEGFDQRKVFHAFTIAIGKNKQLHVQGGNIADYHKQIKGADWLSVWKVV